MQGFKERLDEERMLQEFDMSFTDWIIGGAGIEIGRMGVQIGIAVLLAALYVGVSKGSELVDRIKDYMRRRKGNKAAAEAERWMLSEELFKDVYKMSSEIKELTKKRDRSKSEKNRKELGKVIGQITRNRKSIKQMIARHLESSYEGGGISKEAAKWIVHEAYLSTYMTNPEIAR